jgi:DNA-binding NarL/FixJ family response regulator
MLIEPYAVLRLPLSRWLESDLAPCVILEAADMAQALALASAHTPHAIILDLDALSENNKADTYRLGELCPKAAIIGIGLDDTPSHRQRAKLMGVTIFIPKSQLQTELLRAIQEINSAEPTAHPFQPSEPSSYP